MALSTKWSSNGSLPLHAAILKTVATSNWFYGLSNACVRTCGYTSGTGSCNDNCTKLRQLANWWAVQNRDILCLLMNYHWYLLNCYSSHTWPSSKPESSCRLVQTCCDIEMEPTSQCWMHRRCHWLSGSFWGQGERLLQWVFCGWVYHYHCHHWRVGAKTTDHIHISSEGLQWYWWKPRMDYYVNICW